MDARQLTVFIADVRAQMQLLQRVAALLKLRAEGLQREDAVRLKSVATTGLSTVVKNTFAAFI